LLPAKNNISIIYKQVFFQKIARLAKKVEVFSFPFVKRHLNGVSDLTV
jgi:hypothetical protein